jgi:hypothetical protein
LAYVVNPTDKVPGARIDWHPPISDATAMPITPFINGHRFDPEDKRVLGVAFEMVCIALRVGDCDDGVKRAIAAKIIDLANAGERNPDILCEQALKDIRTLQV